jgi:hypothetical protein
MTLAKPVEASLQNPCLLLLSVKDQKQKGPAAQDLFLSGIFFLII